MNEIEIIRQEVMPIPDQAKMIVVKDNFSLMKANAFFLDIKALRKKIASVFDPIISKAHAAHAEALEQKKQAEAPLIMAEMYLNGQVTDYKREQDRISQEEEEKNRQEAIKVEVERRKQEEDARLARAAELEKIGAHVEAGQIIADAILESVKPLEPYIPPPMTPRVKLNGATVKEYWNAEVTNLTALCRAVGDGKCPLSYVEANMTVLNAQARALKKEMLIPGVKAVSTSGLAVTGRKPTQRPG